MAFVLAKKNQIKVSVKLEEPQDGGGFKKSRIDVTYRTLTTTQLKQLLKDISDENSDIDDEDVMLENIIDIDGVLDEDKQAIPFSNDLLQQMLDVPWIKRVLVKEFFDAQLGGASKN